jgi:hypothetical protein
MAPVAVTATAMMMTVIIMMIRSSKKRRAAATRRAGRPDRTACRLRYESGQISLTQRPLHGAEHLIELR